MPEKRWPKTYECKLRNKKGKENKNFKRKDKFHPFIKKGLMT